MDYRGRRQRLLERFDDGLILVRGAGGRGVNRNFLYLTGLDEPRAALLMASQGVRIETGRSYPGPDYVSGRVVRQVLFLPPEDPLAARWGEDASATLGSLEPDEVGVDAILAEGALPVVLDAALSAGRSLHYVRATTPSLVAEPDVDTVFVERVRRNFFGNAVLDATPAVQEMRRLKDDDEVRAIERSIEVTAEALEAVLARLSPGVAERELEAEIVRVYRKHGAVHSFDPIVGSGANANKLHYVKNEGTVSPGDLVLVDTGASVDGYSADVTRTYPAGGRFDTRQREVYEAVLAAQRAAIEACAPGALLADVHARAFEVIADAGFGDFFPHGTGHHLGLETHDVGDLYRPLEPGAVVTIEPGVYLPEEGIGVRIEDDVLVTAAGRRNLSERIPKGVKEIEAVMASR